MNTIKIDGDFVMTYHLKIWVCVLLSSISIVSLYAQNNSQNPAYSLKGKVIDGLTLKPVSFAIVIVQEANVFGNAPNGLFYVAIPKPGKYTVTIQSQGLQTLTTTMTIDGQVVRDFTLNHFKSTGGTITIRGERDIQQISSHTMTNKQIKEVPATFGDSINALASLPGVNRPGGFFGPLVIRGADPNMNGYYVDDIPLFKPMHFGGLHSVINNDLMSEIDLYSSAFPAQFGNAQAAIININTIDDVKQFGGNADVGLISSNALVKTPITLTHIDDGKATEENKGYVIASGRVGYLSLAIPLIAKYVFNTNLDMVPEYWDYQFKAKYQFDKKNSLTLLAFGNKDYWDFVVKSKYLDPGADPIFAGASFHTNDLANSQGLYYTFKSDEILQNTLLVYAVENQSDLMFDLPESTNDAFHNIHIASQPNVFGIKDKLKLAWWESHGEIRAGAGAIYYDFERNGKSIAPTKQSGGGGRGGGGGFGSNNFEAIQINQKFINKTATWYIENKFTFGGLLIVPGFHSEYLSRSKTTTYDPRGLISYSFPTGTTIGFAGGWYSMFLQTGPAIFTSDPDVAGLDYLKPQRAIHRTVSLEQKIDRYTFKAEGYYNNVWDYIQRDITTDGITTYTNSGKAYSEGIELLAKISDEAEQGLFGWASYSYNKAQYITHQSSQFSQWGDQWLTSPFDMTHVVKIVAGYTFGSHTLSSKFQYNTALPYSQIVGSQSDDAFTAETGKTRIVPIYGQPNTARLAPQYELDVRYSYKTNYRWGYLTWYFELIGVLSSSSPDLRWDYRYPYQSGANPHFQKSNGIASIPIPNFGVEVKF